MKAQRFAVTCPRSHRLFGTGPGSQAGRLSPRSELSRAALAFSSSQTVCVVKHTDSNSAHHLDVVGQLKYALSMVLV